MLIHAVRLENFKSYRKADIVFELGTNAIVGRNGAGKSSILEAIGFALFDHVPTTRQSDLLRDDASSGSVVVRFSSSLDEREYEVERVLGKTGTTRHRVYDVGAGRALLAESVGEVTLWIRDHLGIESSASLDDLFRNTIGVPQGSFTAPFLLAAGERKRIFDPLLQVDEYDRAYQNLRETNRFLTDQGMAIDQEIARLEGLLDQLPGLSREREDLEIEVEVLAVEVRSLQARLAQSRAELRQLDEADRSLRLAEQLRNEIDLQHRVADQNRQKAAQSVAESELAVERLSAAEPGYREYLAAEQRQLGLERDRAARDAALREAEQVRLEQTRTQARLEQAATALDEIAAAAGELDTLQPGIARQIDVQHDLDEAKAAARILDETRRQSRQMDDELSQQLARLDGVDKAMARATELEGCLTSLKDKVDALEAQERQLVDDRSVRQARLDRLREQAALLEREHGAQCPTCEAELSPAHRRELLGRNSDHITAITGELNTILRQLNEATRARDQGRRERTELDKQLRSLPTAEQRQQLAEIVASQRQKCADLIERVAQATAAGTRVAALTAELERLGDPLTRSYVLASRVAERETRQSDRARLLEQERAITGRLQQAQTQLARYATLDASLATVREALAGHRGNHDLYLTQRDTAGQLDQRRGLLADLSRTVEDLSVRLVAAVAQRDDAAGRYDAARHDQLRQQVEEANGAHVQASTRLTARRERLQAVMAQVERLVEQQDRLQTERAERRTVQRLADTLDTVRNLLRAAGPYVTRQLVTNISAQASAFYSDIMNDYAGRLLWSEDYELTLEIKGRGRSFQQLSGGEQMAAALALRLALLRQLSRINVAFFDEPTAHLDPERRDGLADKIMQVKGFEQLFVISHDDTFERAAQNYIRIVKENDVSMVQVP